MNSSQSKFSNPAETICDSESRPEACSLTFGCNRLIKGLRGEHLPGLLLPNSSTHSVDSCALCLLGDFVTPVAHPDQLLVNRGRIFARGPGSPRERERPSFPVSATTSLSTCLQARATNLISGLRKNEFSSVFTTRGGSLVPIAQRVSPRKSERPSTWKRSLPAITWSLRWPSHSIHREFRQPVSV